MPRGKSVRQRMDEQIMRAALEGRSILEVGLAEDPGESLRGWRVAKGLSLRAAAADLGIPYSILQKLETGGRAKAPDIAFLERVAFVYGVPTPEVFRAAGISVREVRDVRDAVDHAFRELVLEPSLCPTGMDPAWLDSFSTKQKGQWLEFAHKLSKFIEKEGYDPVDLEVVKLVSGKETP
jgi:transcriptional regulator with XRE-family HTH domain